MSIIAMLQIIYLVINVFGTLAVLVLLLPSSTDCVFLPWVFNCVRKYLGKVGTIIVSIFLLFLFIPTITILSLLIIFVLLTST